MGEGDPAAGEDALDPGARPFAVEEVCHDHRLAMAGTQGMDDTVAEADGDQGPERERA